MELYVRNVVEALHRGSGLLLNDSNYQPSRAGDTMEALGPVYTIYRNPMERVLFSPARDANPYLHFFEALWMLNGRNDLKFLRLLSKNFEKYSDDGITMQGSYGFRWRGQLRIDQLETITDLLKEDPESRRAVLSMWNAEYDLTNLRSTDIPCNTHAYFKIRGGSLHMTVCNRSNDMLWGAYGANAVHMSMLQEYIAGHLGIPMGFYIQQSDSFHVYLTGPGGEVWARVRNAYERRQLWDDPYEMKEVEPYPMFAKDEKPVVWDQDLDTFFLLWEGGAKIEPARFYTLFFQTVVAPMWESFITRGTEDANLIAASDWRKACVEWLERRAK